MRSQLITVVVLTAIASLFLGILIGYNISVSVPITQRASQSVEPETTHTSITASVTTSTPFKTIYALMGEAVEVDTWRLTVLSVNESLVIRAIGYFQAKEGLKFVVIKIRLENMGVERGVPFGSGPGQLRQLTIITDKGGEYILRDYGDLLVWTVYDPYESIALPNEEVIRLAIDVEYFSFGAVCEPGGVKEGHVWAVIPQNDRPAKLVAVYVPPLHKPPIRIEIALTR